MSGPFMPTDDSVEAAMPLESRVSVSHAVDWDGSEYTSNPQNWSDRKRWTHVVTVAALGLIPNMATAMIAPGINGVVNEFNVTSSAVSTLAVTIFLLGMALGPLIFSSLSEIYGRLPVYHASSLVFIAFMIGNALSQNIAQFFIFRFLSGVAGGIPLAMGGGTIADVTHPAQRGFATALFSLGPLAGPVLGPVVGGFIVAAKGWRWTFWLLAILGGAVEAATIAVMRETSPKSLLKRRAERLLASGGNHELDPKLTLPLEPDLGLSKAFTRPAMLLFRSPIVLALSLYAALVFGVIYLLFTTFDDVFRGRYRFSAQVSGLPYLGLGIALVAGVVIFVHIYPQVQVARMKADGVDQPKPEYRLVLMIWLSPCVGVGLFIYGWTVNHSVHWIVPIIGTFVIGLGAYFVLMPSQLYLIDHFGSQRAASALGAYNLLRYLGGTFLPLAGPKLYSSLGFGWGSTLLGFLALVFALPPVLFYRYGERLRAREI